MVAGRPRVGNRRAPGWQSGRADESMRRCTCRDMTTVAVVVTSHNYRAFVTEAVDGALRQSRPPEQLIVVDDGSTDGSPELLRERYGADARVELLCEDNGGQLSAFQRGLARVTADLVCFLDADDRWTPGYLSAVTGAFDSRPEVDFVFSDYVLFGKRSGAVAFADRAVELGYTVASTWALAHWYGAPTSAVAMRTSLARRCLDLPESFRDDWRLCADSCLVLGASVLGARKSFVPTGGVEYRVHDGNLWWWKDEDAAHRYLDRLRRRRLIAHYARVAGVDESCIELARLEFATRSHASWNDAWRYVGLCMRRRAPIWNRVEDAIDVIRRWAAIR